MLRQCSRRRAKLDATDERFVVRYLSTEWYALVRMWANMLRACSSRFRQPQTLTSMRLSMMSFCFEFRYLFHHFNVTKEWTFHIWFRLPTPRSFSLVRLWFYELKYSRDDEMPMNKWWCVASSCDQNARPNWRVLFLFCEHFRIVFSMPKHFPFTIK